MGMLGPESVAAVTCMEGKAPLLMKQREAWRARKRRNLPLFWVSPTSSDNTSL